MEAFVRFEEYHVHGKPDPIYIARIEPQFDILPLITCFFRNRYANQQWLIFDVSRSYGVYFDKTAVHQIRDLDVSRGHTALSECERHCQKLWQRYFISTTITSRINLRQHRQMMPQRYWRYLTEKRPMLP
ncbi:TIGR03915 family putative DNA repair protein [Neisseria iguanae]|uniref:TIGR03915 family putative DNA repair protein n=1 Tax=Neisseria iguanae TaxID=90242 RepID=UPI001FE4AA38|nr:TIGR03915 family putative DNA repair protein [Neisseria iguanae]